MIYILEGPDGTGKTTLAREICSQLDAGYTHLTYRWKPRIFDYHTAAIRHAARQVWLTGKPFVIDRWWPTEAVYAHAYRGGSSWPLQGRMADRIARKFGAIYVYCTPDNAEEVVARHEKLKGVREEMYDDISKVAQLYVDLWWGGTSWQGSGQYIDQLIANGGIRWRPDTVRYGTNDWANLKHFVTQLADTAADWQKHQWDKALNYHYWNIAGHIKTAEYLVVGEQVNPKHRELFWPFYEYRNSSLYLTQIMHEHNFEECGFMWANILDHHGNVDPSLAELLEIKPTLKVVPMGKKAASILKRHDVPIHYELPHPSWAKRFGHTIVYKELIKNAFSK